MTLGDVKNTVFGIINLCNDAKIKIIMAGMDDKTKEAFQTWMTLQEIIGHSPEINYRSLGNQKTHITATKDHLEEGFINYESKLGDEKTEVGL